jgi:hypothetical protein
MLFVLLIRQDPSLNNKKVVDLFCKFYCGFQDSHNSGENDNSWFDAAKLFEDRLMHGQEAPDKGLEKESSSIEEHKDHGERVIIYKIT